jgi:hypothetical protein
VCWAATLLVEPFTGATTATGWTRFGTDPATGCLTVSGASGSVPSCPAGERGGLSGTLPDPAGQGVLRLTSDDFGRRGFVIFGTPFATANGLVITFDLFAYGVRGGVNPLTGLR